MIKLIVADIDNTLVPKHRDISERTRNNIKEVQEKGILFGLASGRSVEQLHLLEKQWNIHSDVLIGLNGSQLYDGLANTTKMYYKMEPQWIKQALDIMHEFDCNPSLERNGIYYVGKMDQSAKSSQNYLKNKRDSILVKSEEEFYEGPSAKICFRIKEEDWPTIEKKLQQYHFDSFTAFRTEYTMLEFCNVHASKGNLLKEFCQKHDIALEDVAAFGDMTNDISMLEIVGMSVCLLNGSDDAKQASKYITDYDVNNEGFADFIEKHIL